MSTGGNEHDDRGLEHRSLREMVTYNQFKLAPMPEDSRWEGVDDGSRGINVRDLWQVLLRRKWTIVVAFLAAVVTVAAFTFTATPVYRATATVQIEREAPTVVEGGGVLPGESSAEREFYETQYGLLRSRSLALRVIREAGLSDSPLLVPADDGGLAHLSTKLLGVKDVAATRPPSEQDLVSAFLEALEIEPVRGSRLARIHFNHGDAAFAAEAVNAVADAYISLNLERRFSATSYARGFLDERLSEVKDRLEAAEQDLIAFARREQIVSADDGANISERHLQDINSALARAEEERIKAGALLRQMEGGRDQMLTSVLANSLVQHLKEVLARLESQYQQDLRELKPHYPAMRQLKAEIEELRATLDQEIELIRSALRADYQAARRQEEALRSRLEQAKNEALALQHRSIRYNMLKREVDSSRELYDRLLQRYQEVNLSAGVTSNNISVVDRAHAPTSRHKPSVQKNIALGLLLGLFGGVGLAFLREHLDDSIRKPDQLEVSTGTRMLGIIPATERAWVPSRKARELVRFARNNPRSGFAQGYRWTRTALQYVLPEGAPKVVLVTSPGVGEGKTTSAANLALQFAQADKKVLLIDADLHSPSLHRVMGVAGCLGLADYLSGDAEANDVVLRTQESGLCMVPAGTLAADSVELLASPRMRALLELVLERFDHVILDGPPVLGVADALVLGNVADATVLVAQAGKTRSGHARSAAKDLRAAQGHIVGAILTRFDDSASPYGYRRPYFSTARSLLAKRSAG